MRRGSPPIRFALGLLGVLGTLGTLGRVAAGRPSDGRLPELPDASDASDASVERARGIAAFETIYRVLVSPRCMNCHPTGDAPLQGDDSHPHAMNITRASEVAGLPCSTCHRRQNGTRPHMPPGAPRWDLPPRAKPMVFQGKTAPALCAQIKNPRENGGKSLAEIGDHLDHDAVVLWGFAPGPGRTLPPVPQPDFARAARRWIEAGAPCP